MAKESSAVAGSGISVLREGLAPGHELVIRSLRGTNAVIVNYEDINSKIGIIQASGLTVSPDVVHLNGPDDRLRGRRQVLIQNLSADAVFIGGTIGVTVLTGYRIDQDESLTLDVLDHGDIFILSAGVSDVRILELK